MTGRNEEIAIGPLSAIPLGEGRTFEVRGERVAVFRTRAGEVYAVQAECPHKGGPLADGLVGGTTVICPLHAWKFDLTTGLPLMGTCALKTFPVRVDGANQILIRLTQGGSGDLAKIEALPAMSSVSARIH